MGLGGVASLILSLSYCKITAMHDPIIFAIIAFLLVVSPGPNLVLIVKTVGSRGTKMAAVKVLGLVAATFIHGALSIFGFSAIIVQSAELFAIVKYLGAAYLLYLGVKTVLATFAESPRREVNRSLKPRPRAKTNAYFHFSEGFFTHLFNPKVSMFYLAAFPQFISIQSASYYAAFVLVTIHAAIIFTYFISVATFANQIKRSATSDKIGRWVQRTSGGLMIYFSGLLIAQESPAK